DPRAVTWPHMHVTRARHRMRCRRFASPVRTGTSRAPSCIVRRTLPALFVALAVAACGGSSTSVASEPAPAAPEATPSRTPGSAQVAGSVEGDALPMVDAVLVPGTHGARVMLVDHTDYCEHP